MLGYPMKKKQPKKREKSSLQQQQPQSFICSDYIGGKLVLEAHAKTRELPAKTDVGL